MRRAVHAGLDVVENALGILGARIVARGDGDVRALHGNASHLGALPAIAVAAAAEDDDQPARGEGSHRIDRALESIGRMRVVAEHDGPAVDDLDVADEVLLGEVRPLVPGVTADDVDHAVVVDVEGGHGDELGLRVEGVAAEEDIPGRAGRGQEQHRADHQPPAAARPSHDPPSHALEAG